MFITTSIQEPVTARISAAAKAAGIIAKRLEGLRAADASTGVGQEPSEALQRSVFMCRTGTLIAVLAVALVLIAGPSLAYTIFLKDGTTLIAKEEFRIDGDRAIITLPSGTETFLALSEIDVERTREFNKANLGNAMLIEDGEIKAVPTEVPDAGPSTLGDLIATGQAVPRVRPEARRQQRVESTGPRTTTAGYLDFSTIRRQAYDNLEFMSELRSYFTSQGLEAQVFRGSQSDRPLVQVVTSSESSVFKSLQVASQAMAQMGDRHGSRLAGIELLLQTSRGSAAGQFLLTPELAAEINSSTVDVAGFFVDHVRF
jgi:hypothetical protein